MDKDSLNFLQRLCDAPGPPGFEAPVSRLMREYAEPYCDRVYTDRLGNMMFEKVGQDDGPVVLIAGHVDECGFIITGVNPQGYLSFSQLGGWFDQVLLGQKVLVHTREGDRKGVIACKPPHLMEPEEAKKVITKDRMFIDIGASNKEEAEAMGVRLGDAVTPDSQFFTVIKNAYKGGKPAGKRTLAFGKAFDNRLGAFSTVQGPQVLSKGRSGHPNRLISAATVQEVGTRGQDRGRVHQPRRGHRSGRGHRGDIPRIDPLQAPALMGEGISITVYDGTMTTQPAPEGAGHIHMRTQEDTPSAGVCGAWRRDGWGHTHLSHRGPHYRHRHTHPLTYTPMWDLRPRDMGACNKLVLEMVKALDAGPWIR